MNDKKEDKTSVENLVLSHSKMEVARKCMRKFKYKYIDHIKLDQDDQSASDFGNVCHFIGEHYTGNGKAELLYLYHKIVPSQYQLTEFYRNKIPIALKNIHEHWAKCLSTKKKVQHELDFTVELTHQIKLTGKIDLMIEGFDDRYLIQDYKTSKSRKYLNATDQLAMYMIMLNIKYGIPYNKMDTEIIYLALDPFEKNGSVVANTGYNNIIESYTVGDADIELLKREITVLHRRIGKALQSGEWVASPDWFTCKYCEFNKICDDAFDPSKDIT